MEMTGQGALSDDPRHLLLWLAADELAEEVSRKLVQRPAWTVERITSLEALAECLPSSPADAVITGPGEASTIDPVAQVRAYRSDLPMICLVGAIGEQAVLELLRHGATDCVPLDRLADLPRVVERVVGTAAETGRISYAHQAGGDPATITVAFALRELVHVESSSEAVDVLVRTVADLGGEVLPAADADDRALPIDLSLGAGPALLPAGATPEIRTVLERHLPVLVEDARRLVELARGLRQMQRDTLRDPLTGLLNRRGLRRVASRTGPADVVVMIDLDGFKQLNDTEGHASGDELLVAFATLLTDRFRPEDRIARPGGDEFILILRELRPPTAAQLVERFRTAWHASRAHQVDFSAGVAGMDGRHFDAALVAADDACYQAKAAGRSRVVLADREVAE